jgi:protein O-mannosyl-transferase
LEILQRKTSGPPGWLATSERLLNSIFRRHRRALVALLTVLAYADTLRFRFVYDDYPQIIVNPRLTSWHYLPQYFTSDVWSHYFANAAIHYYRPIFSIWLFINYTLFRLHPLGWHAMNVILHLTVTVLVWNFVERLTSDREVAFFASLIFGLHPIHTEVVAWVSASSEMLLTIFIVVSLLCVMKASRAGNRIAWTTASLVFYAAALLTKETAIVLPAAVFLLGWLYAGEQSAYKDKLLTSLRLALPFAILSCGYWLLRSAILKNESYTVSAVSYLSMVMTWPSLLCVYARLLIFPVGLSEFYTFAPVTSWSVRACLLPLLFLSAIVSLLTLWWRKSGLKLVAFGSIWTILWLVPVLYIRAFQPGEILHDRYLYLPSIGFSLLAGMAIRNVFGSFQEDGGMVKAATATAIITIVLVSLNISQHSFWKNDVALYERGMRTAPNNRKVKLNLANALVDRGRYEDGIPMYMDLLKDAPKDWPLLYNLGFGSYQLNRLRDAEAYLDAAIAVDPSNADEHKFAGLTQAKLGRPALAEDHLKMAIRLKQQGIGYHLALAQFYEQQGRTQDAIREYEAELLLTPRDAKLEQHIKELQRRSALHCHFTVLGFQPSLPARYRSGENWAATCPVS